MYENNPDDFRFSKEIEEKASDPLLNRLNQNIGTPSHIEYLKMSENDTHRHKSRCLEYDKKKNVCMCVKSPYFTMHCCGSSHCKYYVEKSNNIAVANIPLKKEKEVIVVSAKETRVCKYCGGKTQQDLMYVSYRKNGKLTNNKLITFRCFDCNKTYISDKTRSMYMNGKDENDVNIKFIE